MTNSQLWAVCGAFLAGSLVIAGTNVVLVRTAVRSSQPGRRPVIAMMPASRGDAYSLSCREGAEEAARELGIELLWDGPISPDSTAQIRIVDSWITRHVDALAVAAADEASLSPVLRRARASGIGVVSWDADVQSDARDLFVNPARPEEIGEILASEAECLLDDRAEFGILAAGSKPSAEAIRTRLAGKRLGPKLAAIRSTGHDRDRAFQETRALLQMRPSVKLVVALSPAGVSGAADAVVGSGMADVQVIGIGVPASCRRYLDSGVMPLVIHWSTQDLGYLAAYTASMLAQHRLGPGDDFMMAGRLGRRGLTAGEIVLDAPLVERSAVASHAAP